jgi:hypothetical protein
VLRQTELSATPPADRLTVKVNGQDVPGAARQRMARLPADGYWTRQRSVTTPPDQGTAPTTIQDFVRTQGVELLVANCDTLRRNTRRPLENCRDGSHYRVQATASSPASSPMSLPVGLPVRYVGGDGRETTITVPEAAIDLSSGEGMPRAMAILVAGNASPVGLTDETFVFYQLVPDIVPVDRFATQLAAIAPAATMRSSALISMRSRPTACIGASSAWGCCWRSLSVSQRS